MLDFVMIDDKGFQKDTRIIKPKFDLSKIPPNDLMIRGGDIYAVWDENTKLWVTEADAFKYIVKSIDKDLKECADKWREQGGVVKVKWMWDSDSGSMDRFLKYVKRQMPTNCYKPLDSKLIFSNMETKREDYASKKLPYPLIKGEYPNYEELISTLYNPENRRKLEWAIGSIIHGDSRSLQKFVVIYGEAGSGKSTILNIIQELCKGYWTTFDAKGLGQAGNQFPLESFKDDPIVAIQHDGDLSKIEDNTRLNSLVSHESVEMNIKNLKKFPMTIHSFMFIGTNSPVKFTDGKSGLQRRLIDVHPSGKRIPTKKYGEIMAQIPFELGAIAYHCLEVYKKLGKHYYDDYIPIDMLAATNEFYNFVEHNYEKYKNAEFVTLSEAWAAYDEYCSFANAYKMPWRIFRTELRNYFKDYTDRMTVNGVRIRNVYSGFRSEKFDRKEVDDGRHNSGSSDPFDDADSNISDPEPSWLIFENQESVFDKEFKDWKAQYETDYGKGPQPEFKWDNVKTTLKDLDTSKTHYVKPPDDIPILMMDFDKKGPDGKKSLEENIKAALKFKKTYAELSKSGSGIHLYYIWDGGDTDDLSSVYDIDIEIKTFKGNSAIRRRLSKCNREKIAKLSSGLPKKGVRKTDWTGVANSKMLMSMIEKNLNKEYHGDTSSSINYINSLLDED